MSFDNEMLDLCSRGRGRGRNIFDENKLLSAPSFGIINQQHPMMNQQNSLKHKSPGSQELNDIKRRRCDDDITDPTASGSQQDQVLSSSSSSSINQTVSGLEHRLLPHKINKSCPALQNCGICYIEINCPYNHKINDSWHKNTNDKTNSKNNNKSIGIYSSFYGINDEINWIENSSNVYKIYGYEATMIYCVDESVINEKIKKPSKITSHSRKSMNKIDRENKINQLNTDDNSKLLPLYCPNNCSSFSYQNLMEYARHFVIIHYYPIIYYDQPILLHFDMENDWICHLSDKKFMTRHIVKFMFKENKYFLLESWTDNAKRYIQLYDFTYDSLSSYQYYITSSNMNNHLCSDKMIPIIGLHNSNPRYQEINSMDNVVLYIKNENRKVNYTPHSFIERGNCPLCHKNHIVSSCDYFFILNNMNHFDTLKELLEKSQGKLSHINYSDDNLNLKIEKFKSFERSKALERQRNFENNTILLELPPIVIITMTELLFKLDNSAKFILKKLYEQQEILEEIKLKRDAIKNTYLNLPENNSTFEEITDEQKQLFLDYINYLSNYDINHDNSVKTEKIINVNTGLSKKLKDKGNQTRKEFIKLFFIDIESINEDSTEFIFIGKEKNIKITEYFINNIMERGDYKTYGIFKKMKKIETDNIKQKKILSENRMTLKNNLPINECYNNFIIKYSENNCIIITGGTGSGKSTQIPQWCSHHDLTKIIVCSQPRSIAITSLAARVATEKNVQLGNEVGYKTRFDSKYKEQCTKILYMTNDVLLNEMMSDVNLTKYGTIIIDEAHEQSTETDILIGLLKSILKNNKNLKIIIMSATLNINTFNEVFNYPPVITAPEAMFKADVHYTKSINNLRAILETVADKINHICQNIMTNNSNNNILVFLPGKEELDRVENLIENLKNKDTIIMKLHSSLSDDEQKKIYQTKKERKIILSTNIAETSITIDNIGFVIDSGLVKEPYYNYINGTNILILKLISKACSNQRMSLAGRTCEGVCFRIYSKEVYYKMDENTTCAVDYENLENSVLKITNFCGDIYGFPLPNLIHPEKLNKTLETLLYYGAIDNQKQITNLGKLILKIPLSPNMAKILIKSYDYNCHISITKIISMLTANICVSLFSSKQLSLDRDDDFLKLLSIFNTYTKIDNDIERSKWCRNNGFTQESLDNAKKKNNDLIEKGKSLNLNSNKNTSINNDNNHNLMIKKSLMEGYFMQVAVEDSWCDDNNTYNSIQDNSNEKMQLNKNSACLNKNFDWIIYDNCWKNNNDTYYTLNNITNIEPKDLYNIAPQYFKKLFEDNINNCINELKLKLSIN